jgi:hypothetical protein
MGRGLGHMAPRFALHDAANRGMVYAILRCEHSEGDAIGSIPLTDGLHLGSGQLCAPLPLAARDSLGVLPCVMEVTSWIAFRMKAPPIPFTPSQSLGMQSRRVLLPTPDRLRMGARTMTLAGCPPLLCHRVRRVVLRRAQKQMRWIHAVAVRRVTALVAHIAGMTDVQMVRNWAVSHFPGNPVRPNVGLARVVPERAIPSLHTRTLPQPARIWLTPGYFRPETFRQSQLPCRTSTRPRAETPRHRWGPRKQSATLSALIGDWHYPIMGVFLRCVKKDWGEA